jgi:hypothetical protein
VNYRRAPPELYGRLHFSATILFRAPTSIAARCGAAWHSDLPLGGG